MLDQIISGQDLAAGENTGDRDAERRREPARAYL
jgi:hypothetical protein